PSTFVFSSRRRHTRFSRDWSSDVCSSDLLFALLAMVVGFLEADRVVHWPDESSSAPEAQEVAVTVVMRNFRYVPEELRIPAGTRAVVVDEAEGPHNDVPGAGQRLRAPPS